MTDVTEDQYNSNKEFDYKKPKKDSPEVAKLKEDVKDMAKRLTTCEDRVVASINDSRTQRKNMIALQENMKSLQRDFERTTREVMRLNRVIEAMLREDPDDRGNR